MTVNLLFLVLGVYPLTVLLFYVVARHLKPIDDSESQREFLEFLRKPSTAFTWPYLAFCALVL